jgi:GT2 family glycosyltransferase
VDGSPDWDRTRDRLLSDDAVRSSAVPVTYVRANRLSLPSQRNQGIGLSQSDILFFPDDDMLAYPDAAARALRVYASDPENRIIGVGLAQPPAPPDGPVVEGPVAAHATTPPGGLQRRLVGWFRPYDFPPYGGERPVDGSGVSEKGGERIVPLADLKGWTMTFRRSLFAKELFADVLSRYAPMEDLDLQMRARRHGTLWGALDAQCHHMYISGGRPNIPVTETLNILNATVLHRLYGTDRDYSRKTVRSFARRRLGWALIKDVARRSFGLRHARSAWAAYRTVGRVFRMGDDEVREWYLSYQDELFAASNAATSGKGR